MRKIIITLILTVPMLASAQNLITNGTFEAFSGSLSSGYAAVNAGSTSLSGWTVGGTSVDVVVGNFGAITGNSIDMLGTPGPGSLSQTFATTVGQAYTLSFSLNSNGIGGAPDKTLLVDLTGVSQQNYTGTTTTTPYTFSFIANHASTTLTFTSGNSANSGGAVLDNVVVTSVPEPETYAMLLAGLGLIGVVSRRRMAKPII